MAEPERPCPLCGGQALKPFLTRRKVPTVQNLRLPTAAAARSLPRGLLRLAVCQACGFVCNTAFQAELVDYGGHYNNSQNASPAFEAHLAERVQHMVEAAGVRDCRVVEVGCGKGDFLRKLVLAGNEGLGFDTSYEGPSSLLEGRLRFERRYFGPEAEAVEADVVVCRHVIEHVAEPVAFLKALGQALKPGTRLFLETPCVAWIFRHQVLWDVFYEHCNYFAAEVLASALAAAGFVQAEVGHVFGGQYLWAEATWSSSPQAPQFQPGPWPALAQAFGQHEGQGLKALSRQVEALALEGGVALWGAGAKGVSLANLVDPEGRILQAVVDIHPDKQGGFLPGTAHPIVAPEALPALGVRHVVLMNPNYRAENEALLKAQGLAVTLVELAL